MTDTDSPPLDDDAASFGDHSDEPGRGVARPHRRHDPVSVRIELDSCLLPGTSDSRRLLLLWFVKKSFWWMFFGGTAVASIVHFVERVDNSFEVDYRSPVSVEHGLLSAWFFVVLAILLRIAVGWIALALAYPLARSHDHVLTPRTGWNRHYATMSDRYKVAKAFRMLRWTHHVRQNALDRVSPGPSWWRRADPVLDIVNVVGVVAFVLVAITIATIDIADLIG